MRIGVIGAGSWGTALSQLLAGKGYEVTIWDINQEHLKEMAEARENLRYLPGVKLHERIRFAQTAAEALAGRDVALFSVPAQHFRSAFAAAFSSIEPGALIVNVAKGIEQKSLMRMSEIAFELFPCRERYVVLSGPSHAEEVGRCLPTTVAVASCSKEAALRGQDLFMDKWFRVYTNEDVAGVELGGALKNIIALAAGISDGTGFGDNAKAALMTRGIAEMTRLGVRLGADVHTFSGLSGIGDLIVTCTSMHSRNRRCGILIGEGMPPEKAVEKVGMVVEGMYTCEAAYGLAQQVGVEMPITEALYAVINGKLEAKHAVSLLMERGRRAEKEELV